MRYLIMPIAAALLLFAHFGAGPRLSPRELWQLFKLSVTGHLLRRRAGDLRHPLVDRLLQLIILAIGPVFTLLILRWRQRASDRGRVAGVALAVCGVLVFLRQADGRNGQAGGGDLTLPVAAAFSLYTVNAKPLIERHGGVIVMAYGTLLGSLPVLAVSAAQGPCVDWAAVSWPIWLGTLLRGAGGRLPRLDRLGLDQRRARRGAHRAADVPGCRRWAAGGPGSSAASATARPAARASGHHAGRGCVGAIVAGIAAADAA